MSGKGEFFRDGDAGLEKPDRDEWDEMGAALGWSPTRIASERHAAGQAQKVQDNKKVKGS